MIVSIQCYSVSHRCGWVLIWNKLFFSLLVCLLNYSGLFQIYIQFSAKQIYIVRAEGRLNTFLFIQMFWNSLKQWKWNIFGLPFLLNFFAGISKNLFMNKNVNQLSYSQHWPIIFLVWPRLERVVTHVANRSYKRDLKRPGSWSAGMFPWLLWTGVTTEQSDSRYGERRGEGGTNIDSHSHGQTGWVSQTRGTINRIILSVTFRLVSFLNFRNWDFPKLDINMNSRIGCVVKSLWKSKQFLTLC